MSTAARRQSARLFARAKKILPGGVDSPVRAFSAVGGAPPFIRRGRGARIEDEDGGSYVDFVMSWGALIHGHAPAGLTRVLAAAAKQGTSFGAPTAAEVELGTTVRRLMPSLERVRFVNSGTEAAMSALRLARAATGRDRVVKFAGCYHGHGDAFRAGGVRGHHPRRPHQPGVPRSVVAWSRGCPYDCTFCSIIEIYNRSTRFRSPEAVVDATDPPRRRKGLHRLLRQAAQPGRPAHG